MLKALRKSVKRSQATAPLCIVCQKVPVAKTTLYGNTCTSCDDVCNLMTNAPATVYTSWRKSLPTN